MRFKAGVYNTYPVFFLLNIIAFILRFDFIASRNENAQYIKNPTAIMSKRLVLKFMLTGFIVE